MATWSPAQTILLLALARSSPHPGQVQPPATFGAGTDLVYVEVSVTDKRGHAIRGLRASDFTLTVDGRAAAVDAFQPPPAESPVKAGTASLPTPAASSQPHEPVTFVVYVDNGSLARWPSYLHAPRPDVGTGRTLAALLAGLEEDTLGADITIEAPGGPDPNRGLVRVVVPVDRLALPDAASGRRQLRIVIALWKGAATERALDLREKTIDVPVVESGSAPGPERREFLVEIPMDAADDVLAVGVLDVFSDRATYKRVRSHG